MKNWLKLIPLIIILGLTIFYNDNITHFFIKKIVFNEKIYLNDSNEYKLNYDFKYIKQTNDFVAKNKQELINIFYTFLNNGNDQFYFYCDYDNCNNDINSLTNENELSYINNFLHPYNSYKKVSITINSYNKIEAFVEKSYNSDIIEKTNKKLDEIIDEILDQNMTDKEKITSIHNYIIETTSYDSNYLDTNLIDINNPSHKAIGPLFYHKALCGGYTDAMALFLNKLKIPNYRISSETHIWNYVYVDNNWYHLDLTWDDPVMDDGSEVILDNFLLITTKQLEDYNTGYHTYDKSIYIEAS